MLKISKLICWILVSIALIRILIRWNHELNYSIKYIISNNEDDFIPPFIHHRILQLAFVSKDFVSAESNRIFCRSFLMGFSIK